MRTMIRWQCESVADYESSRVTVRPGEVTVSGCARVHLGALDLAGSAPLGGGFGFGIPELSFQVRARHDLDTGTTQLPDILSSALPPVAKRMCLDYRAVAIDLAGDVLEHRGFGATTQVTVAAIQALRRLNDLPVADPREMAAAGVGAFSSLGIRLAFDATPIIDLGRDRMSVEPNSSDYPVRIPLSGALRVHMPPAWRAIAAWPHALAGMSETEDEAFWERILPVSERRTDRACRAVLLDLIAGVGTGSFEIFEEGLRGLNCSGAKPEEWARQPSAVRELAGVLRDSGVEPVLSSVGPAVVVFFPTASRLAPIIDILECRNPGWGWVVTRFHTPEYPS